MFKFLGQNNPNSEYNCNSGRLRLLKQFNKFAICVLSCPKTLLWNTADVKSMPFVVTEMLLHV